VSGFGVNAGIWRDDRYAFNAATGMLTVAPISDLDADGLVDPEDYMTLVANHLVDLSGYTPQQRRALGDLDGDGDNDFDDFRKFQNQYIALNGAAAFGALLRGTIPEPATAMLLWPVAVVALSRVRRRIKQPAAATTNSLSGHRSKSRRSDGRVAAALAAPQRQTASFGRLPC
jgi:hypothetical protein